MTIFGSGHQVVTSLTRPASPIVGQVVYETDTGLFKFWNGSGWVNNQGSPPALTTGQKTALTGVVTGTMVYDSTLGLLQVWNGSAWYAASGLVPLIPPLVNGVANTSAEVIVSSNVGTLSLTNVFPTSITAFRVVLAVTANTSNSFLAAFLTNAGSAIAGTYNTSYRRGVWSPNGSVDPTVTWSEGGVRQPAGFRGFFIGEAATGNTWNNWMTTSFDLFNPSKAQYTSVQGMAMNTAQAGTQTSSVWFTGMQYDKTVCDGISFSGIGTWSGTIRVYGYVA